MDDDMKWQQLKKGPPDYLERTRVPGGWLYRSTQLSLEGDDMQAQSESMVFVPLPVRDEGRTTERDYGVHE